MTLGIPAAAPGAAPRRRVARSTLAAVLALAALATVVAGGARPASAHAVLVTTDPPPGALLEDAPDRVSLEFNEPVQVQAGALVVIDGTGQVISGPPRADGSTVWVELPAGVDGWHAVSWRVVSADGHPVSGAWTFRIGQGADEAPPDLEERAAAASAGSPVARWGWIAGQTASTLAMVVLVGTSFLALIGLWREGRHRIGPMAVAAVVSTVAALAAAAFNGPFSAGGSAVDDLFTGPASGPYLARSLLATAVAVAVVVAGSSSRARVAGIWAAAAAGLLVVPAFSGHAPSDGMVARVAVAAHLVVAACWLGAIPGLLRLVVADGGSAGRVLGRFSLAAGRLLAATVVVGAVAAFVLGGGPSEVNPRWGWLLAVKVGFVAVAALTGLRNRRSDRSAATFDPRRSLAVEVVALVAIVVTSIAMTHNGPPREPDAGPAVIDLQVSEEVRVQLVVDPARTGSNWVHLYTLDPTGMPVDVEEVEVTFGSPERGIAPIRQALQPVGSGHHLGMSHDLGLSGRWEVDIRVRVDRFSEASSSTSISIEG